MLLMGILAGVAVEALVVLVAVALGRTARRADLIERAQAGTAAEGLTTSLPERQPAPVARRIELAQLRTRSTPSALAPAGGARAAGVGRKS